VGGEAVWRSAGRVLVDEEVGGSGWGSGWWTDWGSGVGEVEYLYGRGWMARWGGVSGVLGLACLSVFLLCGSLV